MFYILEVVSQTAEKIVIVVEQTLGCQSGSSTGTHGVDSSVLSENREGGAVMV